MKVKEYQIEVLKNTGQYENIKYILSVIPDDSEEVDFTALHAQIERQHQSIMQSKKTPQAPQAPQAAKKVLTETSPEWAKIVQRLQAKTLQIDKVLEYYEVSYELIEKLKKI